MEGNVSEESQQMLRELVYPGLGSEQVVQMYDRMQNQDHLYEKLFGIETIKTPVLYADTLATHYPVDKRQNVEVLDIGAGTGLVGQQLQKLGFMQIDALEPSNEMIKETIEKNIYRRVYDILITEEKCCIPDSSYDAVITCGTFAENHLPTGALLEFIRLVKPGGVVVAGIRKSFLNTVEAYRDTLEPLMHRLEDDGQWRMLIRQECSGAHAGEDGLIWMFQVTK